MKGRLPCRDCNFPVSMTRQSEDPTIEPTKTMKEIFQWKLLTVLICLLASPVSGADPLPKKDPLYGVARARGEFAIEYLGEDGKKRYTASSYFYQSGGNLRALDQAGKEELIPIQQISALTCLNPISLEEMKKWPDQFNEEDIPIINLEITDAQGKKRSARIYATLFCSFRDDETREHLNLNTGRIVRIIRNTNETVEKEVAISDLIGIKKLINKRWVLSSVKGTKVKTERAAIDYTQLRIAPLSEDPFGKDAQQPMKGRDALPTYVITYPFDDYQPFSPTASIDFSPNLISNPLAAPPGKLRLFSEGKKPNTVEQWMKLNTGPCLNTLALIWRDPKTSWSKPKSLVLADDLPSFPGGTIRFSNVSPWTVTVKHDQESFQLASMKSHLLDARDEVDLEIIFRDKSAYKMKLPPNAKKRTNIFVFRGDASKAGDRILVQKHAEFTDLLKPLEKKQGGLWTLPGPRGEKIKFRKIPTIQFGKERCYALCDNYLNGGYRWGNHSGNLKYAFNSLAMPSRELLGFEEVFFKLLRPPHTFEIREEELTFLNSKREVVLTFLLDK